MNRSRIQVTASVLFASLLASTAFAVTINVPGGQPDIQSAINAASPGDQILVAPGTYVISSTINVTVANLTIQGSGSGSTTLQVAQAVGNAFYIPSAQTTLRDFSIQKTDIAGVHNLIWINANDVTVRDNVIYGPYPGSAWSVNGIVSRAILVSPGHTGLLVQGNTISNLRQPAYIDANVGFTVGSIVNNNVSGTRGWVVAGAKLNFSGNTWGPPENQGAEIALLSTCLPADYPDLLALSNTNGNAYISDQFSGGPSGRATAHVNSSAPPNGFGSISAPYQDVNSGVGNTLAGGTVSVAAGTYIQQVLVNGKNLTIQGAGSGSTTIQAPPTLAASFTTSGPNFPVVFVQNASDVRVRNLTVDGAGVGNANYRLQGVGFWNAGGKVLDCNIVRVRDTPFNGNQAGVGLFGGTNSGARSLEVGNTNISDFQKNGTVFTGAGYVVNMHDCTVTGQGPTGLNAENGIQISGGASGTVTNCAISGIGYTGLSAVACGQLFFGPGTVNVSGGSLSNCQVGTYYIDASGSMLGTNTNTPASYGLGAYGVVGYNSSATLAANAALRTSSSALANRPVPQPIDEMSSAPAASRFNATATLLTLLLDGGCLTGPGTATSEGIEVYSEGGGMNVTARHLDISAWGYGILVDGLGGSVMAADHNAITGNITAGYYGGVGSHTAQANWWGNVGGPGVGGANPVSGAVTTSPWLVSGADLQPGCGFQPGPDNLVSPVAPVVCITPANTCVDVPVQIARTTSDNIRGYSINVQLSGGLTLCSATEDSYLSNVNSTQFQIVALGGGAYTIDCAILGVPCGATAVSGGLFTLHVASLLPSGTGTVTITSVVLRDCANAAVAGSAGAPASVTIQNTAPSAIAGLAAAQVLTGNVAPLAAGNTKITVSWPAPLPGDSVRIYRKGFGQYPEYDDAGGAAPSLPGSYPPAGWALAGIVTSGNTFVDEPGTRDFWYYLAYVKDACGNVGPVSNMTSGTLDYHLGDVDPVIALVHVGDNLVDLADVSDLGFNYGATLALNDPLNFLDVGPTTNFSVSARPTTDNKVQFEDLMMFAINYGVVSAPQMAARPAITSSVDELSLDLPSMPEVGQTFAVGVQLRSIGDVKGVSLELAFDPAVVEPVGVEAGQLLAAQHAQSIALSPTRGGVDVALLGTGLAIAGDGEVARALFRVKSTGESGIRLASAQARDTENRPITLGTASAPVTPRAPLVTTLGAISPNPIQANTTIELSLRHEGRIALDVFDLSGRRVAQLLRGTQPAGTRIVAWSGRADTGAKLAAGMYMVRLEADGVSQMRRVLIVR